MRGPAGPTTGAGMTEDSATTQLGGAMDFLPRYGDGVESKELKNRQKRQILNGEQSKGQKSD